jgi:hypothetical protein
MKNSLIAVVLSVIALDGAAPAQQGVERVAWLQGCWQIAGPDRIIEEQWMAPRAGTMLGMSRAVRGDKVAAYETMMIRESGGNLTFEAHPSGQPAATFASISIEDSQVVFENAAHDFPQQIGYRFKNGSLLAWIAGSVSGKPRRVEFPYVRAACAGR